MTSSGGPHEDPEEAGETGPDPEEQSEPWAKGVAAAAGLTLLYAMGIYAAFHGLWTQSDGALLTLGFLIGMPIGAGSLVVLLADWKGKASAGQHAGLGFLVTVLMLLAGFLMLGEGGVCIVMAAPLFIPLGMLAAFATGAALRGRGNGLRASAVPLIPLLLVQFDLWATYPISLETVSDLIEINAPPALVWRQLTEVRDIRPEELGWTFTQDVAGVPKPVDARLQGRGVGAVRHVRWGGDIRFEEVVTRWEEGRALAWRFRFAPGSIPDRVESHIRVDGAYLQVLSGEYRLEPLPGGRTRLHLSTRYRLATPLNGYCAWWGRIMIGDFHHNVLNVIRGRAERATPPSRTSPNPQVHMDQSLQ